MHNRPDSKRKPPAVDTRPRPRRKTYSVSTYDPGVAPRGGWGWTVRAERLSARALVEALRELREQGYDDQVSIFVRVD